MNNIAGLTIPPIATEIIVNYSKVAPAMRSASREIENGARSITSKFDNIARQGEKLSKIGGDLTKYVSIPTAGVGLAAAKAAIDYESAFAGVRKTVDATESEYKVLSEGIRKMSKELPASAASIAEVTEAAGQLGIEKENILDFTKVMIDLGESTNLSAEQGATQLARFANITGMSQDKFSNLGSVIVDLGNNFATTESEIVDMSMRLAGAGNQAGLSEPQIMGIATALSSVGVEAEMGGSSFSKLLINMKVASETGRDANSVIKSTGYSLRDLQMMASHDAKTFGSLAESMGYTKEELNNLVDASATLEGFSKVTGMTAEEFQKAFEEDAVGAIQTFLKGLKEVEDGGGSAVSILDEMGIKEVRLRDTILRATEASDLFTKATELGTKAWDENTALTNEANQRYETTKSQLEIAKNKVVDLGISVGEKLLPHIISLLDKAEGLTEWFGNLDEKTQSTILKMGGLAIATGPAIKGLGNILSITSKAPKVIGLFNKGLGLLGIGAKATVPAIAGVTKATVGITGAAATAGGAGGLGALSVGLGGAIAAAAPFVGAAAGVGLAAYGIHEAVTQKATPAVDKLADGYVKTGTVMQEINGQMIEMAEMTSVKISEETKNQMESYYSLSEEAQNSTFELFTGIIPITDENLEKITTNVNEMTEQTITAIDDQKNSTIEDFQTMFSQNSSLTEEEKLSVIETTEEMAEERKTKVEGLRDRLLELYEEIKEKGIENCQEERQEIETIYEELATEQIRSVTQSKNEQEVLLNNLKNNTTDITSKMVEETIQKLNEKRDKGIEAAEEEYSNAIELATNWKTEIELAHGQLSKSQERTYQKMIDDAENMKEETITSYEELRREGIETLIEDHGDLTRNIDFDTGLQMSAWQKLKRSAGEAFGGVVSDIDRLNATPLNDKTATYKITSINERVTTYSGDYSKYNPYTGKYVGGRHSSGLDYVPYDGYRAILHRGERVLTERENKEFSKSANGNININIGKVENNTKEDIRKLVQRMGEEVRRQKMGKGAFI